MSTIDQRRHPKGQPRDPNTLRAQYRENSWRCYLATIANYQIVCCENTVGYPILATVWLLVVKLLLISMYWLYHLALLLQFYCHITQQESCAIAKMAARCTVYISWSNEPLRRYGYSKLSKMAACRQLGFDVTGNSAIRSADPENPIPRTKHVVYRITRCGDVAIRVSWGHTEPPFWGEGKVVEGQRWHHSKERWWFPVGFPLWPLRYL